MQHATFKMFEKRASSHRDQGVNDVQLSRLEQKTEELVELTIEIIPELTAKGIELCEVMLNSCKRTHTRFDFCRKMSFFEQQKNTASDRKQGQATRN